MKRVTSVLLLLARSSIYKILAVLAVMAAAQTGLFVRAMRTAAAAQDGFLLETAFARGGALYLFGAAALLITLLLAATGCEGSSRCGYTLRRLQVGEKTVLLLQWGYNCLCYLILWGVQLAVALGLCMLWTARLPDYATSQTVFLAFWRSEFLHPLLPLQDGAIWARNLLVLVTLAAAAAAYPYRQRRGKKTPTALVIALGMTAAGWPVDLNGRTNQLALVFACVLVLMNTAACLWEEEESDA